MKKVVKGRDELRIESSDRIVMESYQLEDGKETKLMEIVSLRTKCPGSVARHRLSGESGLKPFTGKHLSYPF
jgi:hypothetical protein